MHCSQLCKPPPAILLPTPKPDSHEQNQMDVLLRVKGVRRDRTFGLLLTKVSDTTTLVAAFLALAAAGFPLTFAAGFLLTFAAGLLSTYCVRLFVSGCGLALMSLPSSCLCANIGRAPLPDASSHQDFHASQAHWTACIAIASTCAWRTCRRVGEYRAALWR